ncbi:MAG: Nif3-like dinuclear metal center hexameric protein [Bacteroidales bacterium]|jgi:dinuclear metal center YbgI/SA1388 family protein|nr:Nif3-like dinuclear metal center hexameric protein [Bacteroidales bacterium]
MTNVLTIGKITSALEMWAPLSLQEHYDNSGLILGSPSQEVRKVLICFDLKPEVIEEAIAVKADLIISHHPAIFKGLKRIDPLSLLGKMLKQSLENNISWYAMHTNLDNVIDGVNKVLADRLGLKDRHPVLPAETIRLEDRPGAVTVEETGAGVVGNVDAIQGVDLLSLLKEATGVPVVRHSGNCPSVVRRVALCGGAGAFLMDNALQLGVDVLITGDVRYHDFFDAAAKGLWVVDIGHFESEQFAKQTILRFFTKNFPTFAALVSEKETPTVYYF